MLEATVPQKTQLRGILTVSLLRSVSMAVISPVIALFLKQFTHTDAGVGFILALSYGVSIFSTIFGSWLFEKLQRKKGTIVAISLYAVCILLLSVSNKLMFVILFFVLYEFFFMLLQLGVSQYIDHLSTRRNLATHFGENGVLANIGWALGAALGGFMAQQFSYTAVFVASAIVALISLTIFIFSEPKDISPKHPRLHSHLRVFKNVRTYFANPFLRRVYLIGLGFSLFYGILFVAPLFLQEIGASIEQIGLYFSLMAIPWIILELPVGKYADKHQSEKRLFIAGYSLLATATFFFGFSNAPHVAFVFLIFGAIATSLIEYTIFSYYYRFIPETEERTTSVFLTFSSSGFFLGTLIAGIALLFIPFGTFYAILGCVLTFFIFIAAKLPQKKIYGR